MGVAALLVVWVSSVVAGLLLGVLNIEWTHDETGQSPVRVGLLLALASFVAGLSVAVMVGLT